ncbi:unnamed protein product [Ambrosiozyma monospora]|uniref:Unnamed protein product n=1 Tax=Ambrosiozyma monospora TaxID=43982 RepID=A0ACB5TCV7_AMBMO|nr:unnamed protein product [Ambrosiozyma monospora]
MLNGFGVDSVGLDILKDCAYVWQIDGYKGFMAVYQAFLRVSETKHDISIAINGRDVAKKVLQFCCLPYEPEVWPLQLKQQGNLFEKVNSQLMRSAAARMSNLFDIESLGSVLVNLTRIKQNSPFGITDEMNASFTKKIVKVAKKRIRHRIQPVPGTDDVTLAHLFAFLETIVEDMLYLNSHLISEFEAKGDWSFTPMRDAIAKYSIGTSREIINYLTETLLFDQESQKFVRTFKVPPERNDEMQFVLRDINTIRELCQYSNKGFPRKSIDFFFPDFYTMHVEMCETMAEYTQNAIESDKFVPLEAASYSASVRDMFVLFERTLNEAEQMIWPTDIHNAYFVTLLHQRISFIVEQYADQMTEDVIDELSSMDTLPIESKAYTKINNLYTVLKKMDELFRDDVLHAFSSLIRNHGTRRRSHSTNGHTNGGQGGSDGDHLLELFHSCD